MWIDDAKRDPPFRGPKSARKASQLEANHELAWNLRKRVYLPRLEAKSQNTPSIIAPIYLLSTAQLFMMSDSDAGEKKAGVPSWQLDPAQKPLQQDDKPVEEPKPSRETVLARARKFLEEDEVKDASTDKKIAFLESKGLESEDIQDLLGVTRNHEASNTPTPVAEAVISPLSKYQSNTHFSYRSQKPQSNL